MTLRVTLTTILTRCQGEALPVAEVAKETHVRAERAQTNNKKTYMAPAPAKRTRELFFIVDFSVRDTMPHFDVSGLQ